MNFLSQLNSNNTKSAIKFDSENESNFRSNGFYTTEGGKDLKLLSTIKKSNVIKPYIFEETTSEKHYPSSTRYWDNSIFTFNKSSLSLIPRISQLTLKYIKNYFYVFNNKLDELRRKKKYTIDEKDFQ